MGSVWSRIIGALSIAAVTAACGGEPTSAPGRESGRTGSPTEASSSAAEPPPEASVACPNSMGGECLGELEGGERYRTETFAPQITYATPAGWSNQEDLPGNFLLLPPGRSIDEVDAGAADYVGIYSGASVAAADCAPEPMKGVGLQPDAVVADRDLPDHGLLLLRLLAPEPHRHTTMVTAWMTTPTRPPTMVPLIRMNCRSRPTCSSMRRAASLPSHRSIVWVITVVTSVP